MPQLDLHCPTCGQIDKVDKVSVIAEGEVTQVRGEYGTYTYPTGLAKSLGRPSKPKTDSTSTGCAVVLGTLVLVGGIDVFVRGDILEPLVGLLMALVGLALSIAALSANSRDRKKFDEMLPRWQRAEERWNELYYCRRDDVLFNPHERDRRAITVSAMTQYLYGELEPPQKEPPKQESEEKHIVVRCENCGQKLRIPLRRKTLHVACPKCKHEFNYEFVEGSPVND